GDDNRRNAGKGVGSVPPVGDVVDAPASDHGTGLAAELVEDLLVCTRKALPWCAVAGEHPLVQPFAAVAEPVGIAVVGAGDISVQRHGHLDDYLGHSIAVLLFQVASVCGISSR